jgi:hypothetical protein
MIVSSITIDKTNSMMVKPAREGRDRVAIRFEE